MNHAAVVAHLAALLLVILAPAADAQRQVLSRAELEAGGWTRLSELPFAIRGVARTTVDGINVAPARAAHAWGVAPDGGHWTIMVDGHVVPVTLGGTDVLDLLPLSLAQLDSVTFTQSPVAAAGRIHQAGVLHLHTQRRIRGVRASASHYSGNEAGDPGPFRFTPEATDNVDNSGPFHAARVALGNGRADMDAALRRWTDNITDARLRLRYERASDAAPDLWVRQLAPSIRAGFGGQGWRHDVHAGVSQLRGTFFVPAPQEDQSLATRAIFAGVAGASTIGRPTSASYAISLSQLDADSHDAPLPATMSHRRRELMASAEVSHRGGAFVTAFGATASRHELSDASGAAGAAGAADRSIEPRSTMGIDFRIGVGLPAAGWQRRLDLSAGTGLAGTRAAAVAVMQRDVGSSAAWRATIAGSSRARGDDGAWVDATLFGLAALEAERRTTSSTTLEWLRTVRERRASIGATVTREGGLRAILPDSATRIPSLAAATSPTGSLTSAELHAAIHLPVGGAVLGGATYRMSVPIAGDSVLRDVAATAPRHLLDANITIVPAFDIRVRPALHLASGTRWATADMPAGEPVPAVTRLDLSLEKWFLAKRLRLQLVGRNLLNDVERYHPLGADFRLRVFAGVTASW